MVNQQTVFEPTQKNPKFDNNDSSEKQKYSEREENTVHHSPTDGQWIKSFHEKKRLDSLVKRSEKALYQTKSVFPFDFFPDELSIEPNQINLVVRTFFYSANVQSIPIRNIVDCILETSIFFSTLRIVDVTLGPNVFTIHYLKKGDAKKARRIIQGLLVATQENLDFSRMHPHELTEQVEKLGSA